MDRYILKRSGNTKISLNVKSDESVEKLKKFLKTLPDVQINNINHKGHLIPTTFDNAFQYILNRFICSSQDTHRDPEEIIVRLPVCDVNDYLFYFKHDDEEDLRALIIKYIDFNNKFRMKFKIFKRISKYQIKFYYAESLSKTYEMSNVLNTKLFKVEKILHGKKFEYETFDETIYRVVKEAIRNSKDNFVMEMADRLASAFDILDFDKSSIL